MIDFTRKMYEKHHRDNRPNNFSILEKERGELLSNYIGINKKILDIGCRDGALTKYFYKNNEVLGVDVDVESLGRVSNKLGIETMFLNLNDNWDDISDRQFDIVVAGEIIEHLFYPNKIIENISKILKENGILLGSVPNAFSLKNRLRYLMGNKKFTPLEDPTHINHFSYNDLYKLLKNNFREVKIIGLGRFKFLSKIFPTLIAFDLFFICKK